MRREDNGQSTEYRVQSTEYRVQSTTAVRNANVETSYYGVSTENRYRNSPVAPSSVTGELLFCVFLAAHRNTQN